MRDMVELALRRTAICISVVELAILVRYYAPLIWSVPWFDPERRDLEQYEDNFVSGLLFRDSVYRTLVSVLVAFQLCICAFFVAQLNRHRSKELRAWCCLPVMVGELSMLSLAWVGWVILTAVYLDSEGHMTTGHILGAGLFIAACGFYFLLMMANVFILYPGQWSTREWLLFGLAGVCFVASVVTGCIFAASFFSKSIKFGWVYEHAAFVLFVAAHIWLFVVDGWLEEDAQACVGALSGLDRVRIHRGDVGR